MFNVSMWISTVDQHENGRSFGRLASSTFSKGALFVHVEKTKILAATRGVCLRTFTDFRDDLGFRLDAILGRSGQEGLGPGYTLEPRGSPTVRPPLFAGVRTV